MDLVLDMYRIGSCTEMDLLYRKRHVPNWIYPELFRLSSVLDLILGLILKIGPKACRHLKKIRKLSFRPEFDQKSDLYFQVAHYHRLLRYIL